MSDVWWLLMSALALGADPVKLDIGTRTSAVLEGFTAVGPDGADHVRWTRAPRRILGGVHVDALADGAFGGELTVDVEPGHYNVHALLDLGGDGPDGWGGPGRASLSVNGEVVWESPGYIDAADWLAGPEYARAYRSVYRPTDSVWDRLFLGRHRWVRVEVDTDGPLSIAVEGRLLEALVIGDSLRDNIVAIQEATSAARADHLKHTAPSPWTAPVGGSGVEVAPWAADPNPEEAAPTATWRVRAARGDVVGTTVWVHDPGPVKVALRGMGPLKPELTEVLWQDARGRPSTPARMRPGALEPITTVAKGAQGLPVGIGLHLQVPTSIRPGTYTGVLRLRGRTKHVVRLEVEVPSWSIDPPLPVGTFVTASTPLTNWGGPASPAVVRHLEQTMALHASRGLLAMGIGETLQGVAKGHDDLDDPLLSLVLRRWPELGGRALSWTDPKRAIRGDAYAKDGEVVTAVNIERLRVRLSQLADSPLDIVVPVYEEEAWKHADAVPRVAELLRAIRSTRPASVRFTAHMGHPISWNAAEHFDVVTWNGFPYATRERADALRRNGGLWTYNLNAGRGAAMRAWNLGSEAHLEWRYNDIPGDPFGKVVPGEGNGYSVLAPTGDVWSTTWLQRLSLGVSDARYLATLDRWSGEGGCAPDAEAQAWLEVVRVTLDQAADTVAYDREIWSEEAFDAVRRDAMAHLDRLAERCQVSTGSP